MFPTTNDLENIMLSTTPSMNSNHRVILNSFESDTEQKNKNSPKKILNQISTADKTMGTIAFHNLNYLIKNTQEKCHQSSSKNLFRSWLKCATTKQILFNVSGRFTKGLHAILGPTGCGKTTLLDIIADRKDQRDVSGDISIDGSCRLSSLRYAVGYVVQGNVLCPTLTVRENLSFSANLRLPKSVSAKEKDMRVSSVISELGLEHCADICVGTELLRGISGGEKKRTSIGMELVLSPRILLLDEPTTVCSHPPSRKTSAYTSTHDHIMKCVRLTGLDAATASNVMHCIKALSQQGRTIVFSIHQPSYSIFKLFDTVMLMCKGRCLFHDAPKQVIPYFAAQGYHCELHDNPADFVLDILLNADRKLDILAKLEDAYVDSTMFKELMKSVANNQLQNSHGRTGNFLQPNKFETVESMGREIWYISKRSTLNSVRTPTLASYQVVAAIIIGLFLGLAFNNLEITASPGIRNRIGALYVVLIYQFFIGITAVEPLLQERVLFIHEYSSGYYRISSFVLAKVVCDLCLRIITTTIFSVTAYPMMGLSQTGYQFFIFLLATLMTTLFGSAISFFISAVTPVLSVAVSIFAFIFTVMLMFSGFLIKFTSISKWLSWIRRFSVFHYASDVVSINEFQGLKFCLKNRINVCPVTGDRVLSQQGIAHGSSWDLWKCFLALILLTTAYFILAYIQLRRIRKTT